MKFLFYLFSIPSLIFSNDLLTKLNDIEKDLCSKKVLKMDINAIYTFNQNDRDHWIRNCAIKVIPGSKVLDIGAGTCPYRTFFSHCAYFTHDFKQFEGEKLGGVTEYGVIDYVSDIVNIPVPNNSFDVILCTEVLEHIPFPIKAIYEMGRILKSGGQLILTAPFSCGLHQLPYHYYTGFTPMWYQKILTEAGFDVEQIIPNGGFFKMMSQEIVRAHSAWAAHNRESNYQKNSQLVLDKLFLELLPRFFYDMDEKIFFDQFTVGYHVIARKN